MRHKRIDGELAADVVRLAEQLQARGYKPPASATARGTHRSRTRAGQRRRRAASATVATWQGGKKLARQSYARRRTLAPFVSGLLLYVAGVIFSVSPHGANTIPLFALLVGSVVWWRLRGRQRWHDRRQRRREARANGARRRVPWRRAETATPELVAVAADVRADSDGSTEAGETAPRRSPLAWWRELPWRTKENGYAIAVYVAAMGWLQAAAILGALTTPIPGLLFVGFWPAATPWWWHHRVRPAEPEPEYDDRTEKWDERVADQGCALPGSRLVDIEEIDNGWSATIALPPGKLTTAAALSATDRIASAYEISTTSIVVEPSTTAEAHRARLLVLTINPLQKVIPYPGPGLDRTTGRLPIGIYADGTVAGWQLYTPGSGANHGQISGTTGGGKSQFIQLICTEIRHSGLAVLWLGDPEEGTSVPDWQDAADWFAGGVAEIRRMLQAAERIMDDRKKRRARRTWTDEYGRPRRGFAQFDPTPDEPLLMVIIDEAPDVTKDPECARIIAKIGKKGRKLGVGITLITQVPSLAEFGNDQAMRSMLSSTNVVMFRVSDKYSKQMGMPIDLPVDPNNLPKEWPDGSSTAGLGYLADASRISPFRAMYQEDAYHWATTEADVAELEPAAVTAAGEDYATWRERREARYADDRDDIDEDDTGPAAAAPPRTSGPIGTDTAARHGTARAAILAHLQRSGRIRSGVLAAQLNIPLPTVSSTLTRLEEVGEAIRIGHGIWASADYDFADEIPDDDVA